MEKSVALSTSYDSLFGSLEIGKKYRWQTMLIMIIIGFLLLCFALFFDFTCLRVFHHVTLFFKLGKLRDYDKESEMEQ